MERRGVKIQQQFSITIHFTFEIDFNNVLFECISMVFIELVILEGKQKPGSLGNVLSQAMALLGFHVD